MNKHITKLFLALATVAIVGGGCETNEYNEKYLDGFDNKPGITDIQTLEYTLAEADYGIISGNASNKAIAKEQNKEAALAAVGKNKFFSEDAPASTYLPAFLAANYDKYLSNGSSVAVTYKSGVDTPAELAKMAAAKTYAVKAEDYTKVWGEEITASYFTPAKPAATYLPGILKAGVANPAAGDFVVAEYAYSDQEPATGEEPGEKISKVKDVTVAGEYTVEGWVAATYARGFILSDATGSILIYHNAMPNLTLGSTVKVKGAAAEFNGCMQFDTSKGAATVEQMGTTPKFQYPATPATMTGAQMDSYLTAPSIKYVKYTGTLSISGNYYNVTVDGAATAQGSLSFPFNGQIDASLNGKKVDVAGYLFSVSKSGGVPKFANTIVTSISESGTTPEFIPTGIVAAADPGTYKTKGSVVATYGRGFLLNDGTGGILVYLNKATDLVVGDIVTVDGATTAYAGLKQYGAAAVVAKLENKAYTQPAAQAMVGADLEAYLAAPTVKLVKYVGTLKIDGNYYNVIFDDTTVAQGSLSYPVAGVIDAALDAKKVEVTGYLIGVSSSKFTNTMVVSVKAATASSPEFATRAAVTKKRLAIYTYDGSVWKTTATSTIVNPEDYTQMGSSNANFSASFSANTYLPLFLKYKFPYALEEAEMDVAYHFYNGTTTTIYADRYVFDGSNWTKAMTYELLTGRFLKSEGKWKFNPSRTIVAAPDKSPLSKQYYQACIDWVIANKDAAYTTKNPEATRLTEQEFYSGCASDYTNLNWRINTLPKYYWSYAGEDVAAYADYISDDRVKARASYEAFYKKTEERFAEVMAAALGKLHADQKMIAGMDIIYTVQMMIYSQHIASSTGKVTHAFEFKLVDNGKFEYVKMYALAPEFELMRDENFK